MTYKYLKASPTYGQTQQEIYVNLFQETLNNQFTNASDIFSVEEEVSFGCQTYQDVNVRINHVVSSATGKNLGDDYKQILFQDLAHSVGLGFLYQFNNNYWLTINTERIKNLAASTYVKRCNNTLRWVDGATGAYYSEPCSIDYTITRNKDLVSTSAFVVDPEGMIQVICQFNDRTNLIRPNQRFLFGNEDNWTCFKVMGGGINNYQNTETLDNTTVGFIVLSMDVAAFSDNDDLTNGVAYTDKQIYTLTLSETALTGIATDTRQLYATVTLNGNTVSRNVDWSSSAITKATVSDSGLVTFMATGTATITCHLEGNTSVSDTASVTVSTTPSDYYQIVIQKESISDTGVALPDTNYVLEGNTDYYTVYLYANGTKIGNAFNISCDPAGDTGVSPVPSDHFGFVADTGVSGAGNYFEVENKEMFLTNYLAVTCECVSDTGSPPVPPTTLSATQDIYLKGAW